MTSTQTAGFRAIHPIDFRVMDAEQEPILTIAESTDEHVLRVVIQNASAQTLALAAPLTAASKEGHHFALCFRAGTLSDTSIKRLISGANVTEDTAWAIQGPAQAPQGQKPAVVYLVYKGNDKHLEPGASLELTLRGITAAPGMGARGTLVELLLGQVTYESDPATPITGGRTQYLHITDQRGKKNLPLHVELLGDGRLLNDTAQQQLTVRLTNMQQSSPLAFGDTTELIVSFDAGEQAWALAKSSSGVDVSLNATSSPQPSGGASPEWRVSLGGIKALAPRESIDIQLKNLVASAPGRANLYLRYKNIPGYWSGQFVCTVEKGPLVVKAGNVGIGTQAPVARLSVVGSEGEGAGLQLDNRELKFRGDGQAHFSLFNNRIAKHLTIENSGRADKMGIVGLLRGDGTVADVPPLLAIHTDGNIGIGRGSGTAKLTIAGELEVTGGTTMDFGADGQLRFLGNQADNPAIFALGSGGGPAQQLTFATKGGAEIPQLILCAKQVHVTGLLRLGEDLWKEATLGGGSWQTLARVAYRKDTQGVVHLQGALFGGTRDAFVLFFQFEEGYRPQHTHNTTAKALTQDWTAKTCSLELNEDGWIKIGAAALDDDIRVVLLNGISFKAAAETSHA